MWTARKGRKAARSFRCPCKQRRAASTGAKSRPPPEAETGSGFAEERRSGRKPAWATRRDYLDEWARYLPQRGVANGAKRRFDMSRRRRYRPARGSVRGVTTAEHRAVPQGDMFRSKAWAFGAKRRAHMLRRSRYRPAARRREACQPTGSGTSRGVTAYSVRAAFTGEISAQRGVANGAKRRFDMPRRRRYRPARGSVRGVTTYSVRELAKRDGLLA